MRALEITGERYGKFTVIQRAEVARPRTWWVCRCECGTELVIEGASLRKGERTSCGCGEAEARAVIHRRHGHSGHPGRKDRTPTYHTWTAMRARCRNPRHAKYPEYGGKGIRVCARWDSFDLFLADMGERPPGKTIDRENPWGDYEPGNCRWATPREQRLNQRRMM